jgi:hypothetical protein
MTSTRTIGALVLALVAVVLAACEHNYVYRPTVHTTAAIEGRLASYYAIPPEAPRGFVELASFGFADIRPEGAPKDQKLRSLHIRMVVSNSSDKPWTVDTREQLLALPNQGESRPAFAKVDHGTAPIVEIPPGGKATIDLFYPLPENMQDAKDLPSFDTIWKVQTDARVVAERTPFERLEVKPPPYGYYGYYDYWGPPYWYDPYYYGWVGVRVAPVYVERPVVIRPGPAYAAPPARRVR